MSHTAFPGEHQPTVSGWIVTEESPKRILLLFHRKMQSWLQPGGHIEKDEHPWTALLREVKEETSIDLSHLPGAQQVDEITLELRPPDYLQVQTIPPHGGQPEHFHDDLQYVVRIPWQEVTKQEAESEEIGWFTLEEIADMNLLDNTRRRVEQLLSEEAA